ncbi:hypothetical protein BCR35DRAFT_119529 [Leucosporidium creatinivorum]|uniref:Uncharacterized protein n=1 Tax=Leucosporidium creatinivorum TaxID=106004 RepID=A0A1Y2EZ97_9BASI|nr:hypothetical protein BCR35DRAFT_119529 [Leucosporidium creatinivorum]
MPFPRLQAIRYPQQPGHDLCYGIRLSSSSASASSQQVDSKRKGKGKATHLQQERKDWAIELGKITDDSLKSNLVKGYVGLADGYYYFHITTPNETHTLLATLFLTDLITSTEASSILSLGPHSSRPSSSSSASASASASTLSTRARTTIHRLPSLATLYGAYWAASSATAEALTSATAGGWLAGAAGGMGGVGVAALPVGAGVLAVGGMMVVFGRSRSAAAAAVAREQEQENENEGRELVRERFVGGEVEEEEESGMEMILWNKAVGRRWVDVERVEVLDERELMGEFLSSFGLALEILPSRRAAMRLSPGRSTWLATR